MATTCYVGEDNRIRLQQLQRRLQVLATQGQEQHQLLGDDVMDEAIDLGQIVGLVLATEDAFDITYPDPALSSSA